MRQKIIRILIALLMVLPVSLSLKAFTYEGINYHVIDEDAGTCETRAGYQEKIVNHYYDRPGNEVGGDVVLPSKVYDGDKEYILVGIADRSFCTVDIKSITIPPTVTYIGEKAFYSCKGLGSITIPASCTSIGESAFEKCGTLSIDIQGDIFIGSNAFLDTRTNPLRLGGEVSTNGASLRWLKDDSWILCLYSQKDNVRPNSASGDRNYVYYLDLPISGISVSSTGAYDATISIGAKKEHYEGVIDNLKITGSVFTKYSSTPLMNLDITPGEELHLEELIPYSDYTLKLDWVSESEGWISNYSREFSTRFPQYHCAGHTTQTTVTVTEFYLKETNPLVKVEGIKIGINGDYSEYNNKPLVFKGLNPGSNQYVDISITFNGIQKSISSSLFRTQDIGQSINTDRVSPTSVQLTGIFDAGDANVTQSWWTDENNNKLADGNAVIITGLEPEQSTILKYHIETDNGYSKFVTKEVLTPELELTTLKPRCVSQSCAIVAAETNISDEEPNVGFEWKKYDAPASLAPNEGYAAIYDGRLEGYIKNLQPTSYYNVRAFYKSNAERYYYSDWVTFDPSDFSYFEPTVHTYPANYITGNSASVKGYALAGTDAIDEQGFEYWAEGGNRMRVLSETAAPEGVNTVFATGQVMRATFTGLRPATAYTFRAFVTTASGTTYGEEQTFTTAEDSGVEDVSADATEPEITGYYDITGRRHDEPLRGLNIVLYSDGSTRKVIMR